MNKMFCFIKYWEVPVNYLPRYLLCLVTTFEYLFIDNFAFLLVGALLESLIYI